MLELQFVDMGAEQNPGRSEGQGQLSGIPAWEKQKTEVKAKQESSRLAKFKNDLLITIAKHGVKRVLGATKVDYSPGFDKAFRESVFDGDVPLIVSSHDSHLNGVTLSLTARDTTLAIRELSGSLEFQGYLSPVAISMVTGDQDVQLGRLFEAISPMANENYLYFALRTRPKDKQDYEIKPNRKTVSEAMTEAVETNHGIVLWGEGKVQGGRRVKREGIERLLHLFDSSVYGLQHLDPLAVPTALSIISKSGREAVIIPVATYGDNEVYSPDNRRSTLRAKAAALHLFPAHFTDIKVGTPFKAGPLVEHLRRTQPESKLRDALEDYVGRQIAQLLPPQRRGVFKDKV